MTIPLSVSTEGRLRMEGTTLEYRQRDLIERDSAIVEVFHPEKKEWIRVAEMSAFDAMSQRAGYLYWFVPKKMEIVGDFWEIKFSVTYGEEMRPEWMYRTTPGRGFWFRAAFADFHDWGKSKEDTDIALEAEFAS